MTDYLRIDNSIACGGTDSIYIARFKGASFALKVFSDETALSTEHRAYLAILRAASLHDRVCGFVANVSPAHRESLCLYLHDTISRLHTGAAVAHEDISGDNVIVQEGILWLFDFSDAVFQANCTRERWPPRDHRRLRESRQHFRSG